MGDHSVELAQAIQDGALRRVRTSVVVRIESYDAATQTATILPLVCDEKMTAGERVPYVAKPIPGVPVVWPDTGLRGITMGLEVGSEAIACFRHRSHAEIDAGREDGPVQPAVRRTMSPSDLFVVPGYHRPGADRDAGAFATDGGIVVHYPVAEFARFGDSTAAKALALAEKVDARLQQIESWMTAGGAFFVWAGEIVASISSAGPNIPPPTSPPSSAGPFDTVACDDVKVRS